MLQQMRMQRNTGGLEQLGVDPDSMGIGQNVHIDTGLLNAARYIVILLGAALLVSLVVQAVWLDGDLTLSRALKVGIVAILGPALFWAASGKELSLLRELQNCNGQLEQRVRENKALNRMTQAHLAECLTVAPGRQPEPRADQRSASNFSSWPSVYVRLDTGTDPVHGPASVDQMRRQLEAVVAGSTASIR